MTQFYDFHIKQLDGQPLDLNTLQGKVVVLVNVASKCGFTPQYSGLEKLWQDYRERGLVVIGFPCNQFGAQEPGDAAEIANFCSTTYEVSFPITEKINVNGDDAHPIYQWLKSEKPGILGTEAIKWNFTKFVLDKSGNVAGRFAPQTTPDELREVVDKLL